MPVMNGIEGTAKIRDYLYTEMGIPLEDQPRIIGVTAHSSIDNYVQKGIESGMDEVYGKPLYFSQMNLILNQHYKF